MPFYLQSAGEEALQMGAAAALDLKDMAFTQYREPGIIMWRDFGMQVRGVTTQAVGRTFCPIVGLMPYPDV